MRTPVGVASRQLPAETFGSSSGPLYLRALIAHDWLVNYGGSERVIEEFRTLIPAAGLVTAVCRRGLVPATLADARTTFLQRVPLATSHHPWFLPLMPLAWRSLGAVEDVELVVSSSHACAKAIRVASGIPHVCYCHTPMRYAWNFPAERERVPAGLRPTVSLAMAGFRRWDRRKAAHVTRFVANSSAVARRIESQYGQEASVVHPPVRTEFFTPGGRRDDFFLYVGRFVAYKRAELVLRAFADLPSERLVVVGTGPLERTLRACATANVTFVGAVGDDRLRELYRSARALVAPADEDFGIAMAEAQACGTPVIALAAGGAVDIVDHGSTGWLIERAERGALRDAIIGATPLSGEIIRQRAERFSREAFRRQIREILLDTVAAGC